MSTSTVAQRPPRPNATACAAPHSPMRVPSREPAPLLARPIIEPMAATANTPLESAEREDGSAKRERIGAEQSARRDGGKGDSGSKAARNRPHAQGAESAPADRRRHDGDEDHPGQHASMLEPRELRRHAGSHAEDEAGEGLDEQFLGAVGEHGNKNENGELARGRLRPDLQEGLTKRWLCVGSTSPAPVALGRLRCPKPRGRRAERPRPTPWRSLQQDGRWRKGRENGRQAAR